MNKIRYHYARRVVANPMLKINEVMKGYVPEVIDRISQASETVILMMDQSKNGSRTLDNV